MAIDKNRNIVYTKRDAAVDEESKRKAALNVALLGRDLEASNEDIKHVLESLGLAGEDDI